MTKAAFPSYVGMTPEYENIAYASTQPSMTQSNKKANARARELFSSGNFTYKMPKQLMSPQKRKIDPLDYRGPNMSDCMYHTFQGFNSGRKYMSPKNPTKSLDFNYPKGGVQAV